MTSKLLQRSRTINTREKVSLVATTGLVLAIVVLAIASFPPIRASPSQPDLSNVQVYVQTSGSLKFDSFQITAFNSTGFAVATTQSLYPAAGFELPNGDYIFTVSAVSNNAVAGPMDTRCYAAIEKGAPTSTSGGSATTPSMPINCGYPVSEYGYSQQQISASSSSTVVNVTTQNLTSIATSTVTVKVAFANGTAASGASVSAYVLGGSYWYMPTTTANDQGMWGTTDSTGSASLTVPAVPVQVSAWLSVPVDIPTSQTTVTRIIGGEKVNVTVYWQPTAISLTGTAVIVPPQTSTSITLHVQQQPEYWGMVKGAGGVGYASEGTTGIAAGGLQQGVSNPPGAVQQQTNGQVSAPNEQTVSTQPVTSGLSITILLAIVGAAVAASAASLGLVILRTRHHFIASK